MKSTTKKPDWQKSLEQDKLNAKKMQKSRGGTDPPPPPPPPPPAGK